MSLTRRILTDQISRPSCHDCSNSTSSVKNTINCTIISTISDPLGRYIIAKIQIDDKLYVFVNVYAPNKDKDSIQFFKNLYILLRTEDLDCENNIILGGDFNCPLNPKLEKRGGVMNREKRLLRVLKNPETKIYLWSQKSPAIFCRLDYWLISNNLCDYVQSTGITAAVKTDHAAIDLSISDIADEVKGPGR